jgi:hypothetical protein
VAAARLFSKSSGELIGIHIALALGSQGTQDFRGRRRQAAAPQGQAFAWRRPHRRHLAGCLETAGSRDDQVMAFGDVAEQPQVLSAGIEVAATRLKAGQGGELAPGEARWCMAGGSGQQLARGGMQDIRRDCCSIGDKGQRRWLDWFFRGQGLFRLGWLRVDSDGRRGCSQCGNVGEAGLQSVRDRRYARWRPRAALQAAADGGDLPIAGALDPRVFQYRRFRRPQAPP